MDGPVDHFQWFAVTNNATKSTLGTPVRFSRMDDKKRNCWTKSPPRRFQQAHQCVQELSPSTGPPVLVILRLNSLYWVKKMIFCYYLTCIIFYKMPIYTPDWVAIFTMNVWTGPISAEWGVPACLQHSERERVFQSHTPLPLFASLEKESQQDFSSRQCDLGVGEKRCVKEEEQASVKAVF